jgi:hypothetical protein
VLPIAIAPEPPDFAAKVRSRGRNWLQSRGHPDSGPPPAGVQLPPYWRDCLDDLRLAYREICCYVAVWVPPVVGAGTVEHMVAKSTHLELAYEWTNYRFACGTMNGRHSNFADVLDPCEIRQTPFILEFAGMTVATAPGLAEPAAELAASTLRRLKLNDAECCRLRGIYWDDYVGGDISEDYLRRRSPFVHAEALRQGLL